MNKYDIVVSGAGCAGLHLVLALIKRNYQGNILLIDCYPKHINDRTWSFWEKEDNELEHLVSKKWSQIIFNSPNYHQQFNIHPYQYKVIRGIDFYHYAMNLVQSASNVHFIVDKVTKITNEGKVILEKKETVNARLLFNSTHSWEQQPIQQPFHLLLQHFYGWVIETESEVFDDKAMTYMDFDMPQVGGGAHFIYLLPFNRKRALVEYTVFSSQKLEKETYKERLKKHIDQKLKLHNYKIIEEEFGVIPMTNYPFQKHQSNCVFNIGTSGGYTKPSTGYTFLRSQQKTNLIAHNLVEGRSILPLFKNNSFSRFKRYDDTLLNILYHRKYDERAFFVELFQKKGANKIFKFLDEKTNILEELDIVNISPKWLFFRTFLKELLVSFKKKG